MTLTFQTESWADYRRDCQPLWREHYDELAARKDRMAMKPDERAYMAAEANGALDILTARETGRMVGYIISVVRPHMHYADTLCGFEDAYFLAASHRKGMAGVRLLRAWEARMRARGVQLIFAYTKPFLDLRPIFERLGFDLTDYVMGKWIGDS